MYPSPVGLDLTAEQRQELNGTLLTSDPYRYLIARIGMMLRWADLESDSDEDFVAAHEGEEQREILTDRRFDRLLVRPARITPEISVRFIVTQIATDKYTLRNNPVGSVVPSTAALSQRANVAEWGVWADRSSGSNQLEQVVRQLCQSFSPAEAPLQFARLVLCEQDLWSVMTEQLASFSKVFDDWLHFDIKLLADHARQLTAAHNKVGKGPSVRARDELKVSFFTAPPSADECVPVCALTGPDAVGIFDSPVIEFLVQALEADAYRQGLKLPQLRFDVPAMFAEAYMIVWTAGTMFHVTTTKYFISQVNLPDYLHAPPHPGYSVRGPYTRHVSGKALVGMRIALIDHSGGEPGMRPSGIAFRCLLKPLTFTGYALRNIRVVADKTTEEA